MKSNRALQIICTVASFYLQSHMFDLKGLLAYLRGSDKGPVWISRQYMARQCIFAHAEGPYMQIVHFYYAFSLCKIY